jgi:hypothetical protein
MANWAAFPNGMVSELAEGDALLVQDVSDTTESDTGTTKGVLVGKLVRSTSTVTAIHGPITRAEYDGLTPDPNTMYLIIDG